MFASSPTGGSESMHLMYLMAITAAAHSDRPVERRTSCRTSWPSKALVAAAQRGVRVRIIVPGNDHRFRRRARRLARSAGATCSAPGIQIAEYQPTMYHVKALIVDELLVSVGSTNFDNRSFSLNDEANLNVLDPDFARAAKRHLRRRLAPRAPGHADQLGRPADAAKS